MISIKNLTKIYGENENCFYAVNDVSLEIHQGEFLAIVGRSGCGKSTLLNMIGCVDTFDGGEYRFGDADVKSMTQKELTLLRRDKIGYIYQSYNLIDELNCIDNIELTQGYAGVASKKRRLRAKELLEKVGLAEKAKNYPAQLSGGQQQRIAVARAISNDPEIILADEPTGNLDYGTGIQVMELLKQLNDDGITIVMVTHDEELLSYASKVVQMLDGKFV